MTKNKTIKAHFSPPYSFSTDPGWEVIHGTWGVSDGKYIQTESSGGLYCAIGDSRITNGRISFEAKPTAKPLGLKWTSFGVCIKYIDNNNFIYVRMGAKRIRVEWKEYGVRGRVFFDKGFTPMVNIVYRIAITIDGDQLNIKISDNNYGTKKIPLSGKEGRIGFYTENPTAYDNLNIYPLGAKRERRIKSEKNNIDIR